MDTTENPQANSIVEIIHQTLTNMVQTIVLKELEDLEFDRVGGISADTYGICST